ncbi:MAG: hypothetical protein MUC79_07055 [Thiobacillaceae bacterium]|jgi:hypothetical protein|nr:hypothetical protein [Thiobacillaceae bacterium]
MRETWVWHEVPLREIGQSATFRQLGQRYGQHRAVGLITRLEALQGFVVVNLLAPRNAAFWAVCRRDALLPWEPGHLGKSGLQPDAKTKKLFVQDLRKASVKVTDPTVNLFGGFWRFFPSSSRALPGFSEDGVSVEMDRFISLACSEAMLPRLIAHLESEARQFEDFGFFAIDDHVGLRSPDYIGEETQPYHYLFRRWLLTGYDEKPRAAWLQELCSQLERAVARVDAGDNLDIPIAPIHFIRPAASFLLAGKDMGGRDEVGDATCRLILSLRARLVRALAWPVFYENVCLVLSASSGGEPRRLDGYGRFEPYDVVAELEEYKREMEQRYPCLLENPLRD